MSPRTSFIAELAFKISNRIYYLLLQVAEAKAGGLLSINTYLHENTFLPKDRIHAPIGQIVGD